jgi:hypothetical protein
MEVCVCVVCEETMLYLRDSLSCMYVHECACWVDVVGNRASYQLNQEYLSSC